MSVVGSTPTGGILNKEYKIMKLKIQKLHPDAVLPTRAYPGDAGLDLKAFSTHYDYTPYDGNDDLTYPTPYRIIASFGIAVEIPEGYCGKLHARSSIYKTCCRLSNGVGLIDSGYRGELMAVFDVLPHLAHLPMPDWTKPVAQLVIEKYEPCELEEVLVLSPSERGTGGYGSSDVKGGQE